MGPEALDVLANGESLSRHEDVQAALAELARLRAVAAAAREVVRPIISMADVYDSVLWSRIGDLRVALDARPDAGKETDR